MRIRLTFFIFQEHCCAGDRRSPLQFYFGSILPEELLRDYPYREEDYTRPAQQLFGEYRAKIEP